MTPGQRLVVTLLLAVDFLALGMLLRAILRFVAG